MGKIKGTKENKIVELPLEEFQELIRRLKECEADKEKLKETVNFLNNQISEYNKKYGESNN